MKELKDDLSSVSSVSQRLISDCTNSDNATKILQQVVQVLHTHYSVDSPSEFSSRIELYSYLIFHLQECGAFMEDAIHGFLLSIFNFQKLETITYQPWLISFVLNLILNQSYCARKLIDCIVMPLLVVLKTESEHFLLLETLLTDWISALDTLVNYEFYPSVKVWRLLTQQGIAIPSVLFTSLATKEGAISIFHLASVLHFINSNAETSSLEISQKFLEKLINSENWFKDYFRSEHRNFESAILFDDQLTAKSSCAIFCNLLHPNSAFTFPDSAETCITTFNMMLDSDFAPEIEIIMKLILRFASSQSKAETPGWNDVLPSIFSYMIEGSHNADISAFTLQFAEEFRALFLNYFKAMQSTLIEFSDALIKPSKLLATHPMLDKQLWPKLIKRIKFWVSSVFSNQSRDDKWDAKKHIIDFAAPLIQLLIHLQEKQDFFEENMTVLNTSTKSDSISFQEYCTM